jgi:hypothetical protein
MGIQGIYVKNEGLTPTFLGGSLSKDFVILGFHPELVEGLRVLRGKTNDVL